MKLNAYLLVALLYLSLVGCSEMKRKKKKAKTPEIESFIFKTNYFLTAADQQSSFPNWFNDSIVAKHKIQTIAHKVYVSGTDDAAELKSNKTFWFDEKGKLVQMNRKRFYENFVVENVTFKYSDVTDHAGFMPVEIIDSLHPKEDMNYEYYVKKSYNKEYLVYENSVTGDFLFCVLPKKLQDIVAVDSLFHPTPHDVLMYGQPARPTKQFQIENLVTEKNVMNYRYFKNSKELRRVKRDNYPFYITGNVLVNKKGKCTGFVDSTFSGEKYLNRTVRKLHFEKELPKSILHQGMRSGSNETFEYTYYD